MKPNKIFFWLFIIILNDNVILALLLPISMQLLTTTDFNTSHQIPTLISDSILASGIIFLLSPSFLLSAPIIGWLCDTKGRKSALVISLLLALVGFSLLLVSNLTHDTWLALLGILLFNADSSMTVAQAIITDISQGIKRAYFLGLIVFIIFPAFILVAELINTYLLSTIMVRSAARSDWIFIGLVITMINILLSFRFIPTEAISKKQPGNLELYYSLRRIFFNKKILLLISLLGLLQFGCGFYFETISSYLAVKFHYSNTIISMFKYNYALILTLGLFILYPVLLRRINYQKLLLISLALCAVSAMGVCMVFTPIFQWIFSALLALGEGISISIIWMLLSEAAAPQDIGFVMGIKASIWGLAWSLSVTVGHTLCHVFYLEAPLQAAAVILALSLWIAFSINRMKTEQLSVSSVTLE